MSDRGPLDGLPIACTLTPGRGRDQVARWQAFDRDHALSVERTEAQISVRYAKSADAVARLRELVAQEQDCCGFVDWTIDESGPDLRLVVSGSPEQLAALSLTADADEPTT